MNTRNQAAWDARRCEEGSSDTQARLAAKGEGAGRDAGFAHLGLELLSSAFGASSELTRAIMASHSTEFPFDARTQPILVPLVDAPLQTVISGTRPGRCGPAEPTRFSQQGATVLDYWH